MDVYGRLAWGEPSVTLTARFDSFTRGRFGHPVEDRSLTIREGARIQTFPDHVVFEGNREEGARQVGNAVPPLLARRIAEAILKAAAVQ
jgi:DNA (cytosine-5)-methyltransferase 1